MDRTTRLSPLGPQRLRLLECLGGNTPHAAGYFVPPVDGDIFSAFRQYVDQLSDRWAGELDPHAVSLLAAARLLTGDLSAAAVILDHLPAKATKLDHGAGICLVMPLFVLSTALPLAEDLTDTSRWLAGSTEQASLRAWLAEHGDDRHWVDAAGEYHLAGTAGG
jgi:hypothetical protein